MHLKVYLQLFKVFKSLNLHFCRTNKPSDVCPLANQQGFLQFDLKLHCAEFLPGNYSFKNLFFFIHGLVHPAVLI